LSDPQNPVPPNLPPGGDINRSLIPVNIEDEMRKSYLDYSMSVIIGRALPDIRDGLKPVHRRILYAMSEMGLNWNRPTRKCAKIVGEVLGKFHPHGDASVYDALVRMAQDFSLRYLLIDGQGNFGSVDGDPPAAYRYTEARLSRVAASLLEDIDKETVDFKSNFDDSEEEPEVLPTRVPNMLVNGSSGIAVGMATNIPPHNLTEIVNATIALVNNPALTLIDILPMVPGPDFPTGGYLLGHNGIHDYFTRGRGSLKLRAKAVVEPMEKGGREALVVTELPYQVNKARLIEHAAGLVNEKKIEGISEIRDESDRDGMRIVFELKRGEQADVILNNLYKQTQMQINFGVIMLSIVNGQPRELGLIDCIKRFIDHRVDVVRRRTDYLLRKAREREHLLLGFQKALDNLDAVNELAEIQRLIGEYLEILGSEKAVRAVIVKELKEVQKDFGDERRTKIIADPGDINLEDLVQVEDVAVTVTREGYLKRTAVDTYQRQTRGGKGRIGMGTRTDDFIENLIIASTHTYLLIFTNMGRVYWLKIYEIPDATTTGKGKNIGSLINLQPDETVKTFLPVKNFDTPDQYIVMVTKRGVIKKCESTEFNNPMARGIIAVSLDEGDELIAARLTNGKNYIFMGTYEGMAIRFKEDEVRAMGRPARGVRAMDLAEGDYLVGVEVVEEDGLILSISENGFGKRTPLSEYRLTARGRKGVINMKTTPRIGNVVSILSVKEDTELMIITKEGKIIRIESGQIRQAGRSTQGVRLVKMEEPDHVAAACVIPDAAVVEPNGEGPIQ